MRQILSTLASFLISPMNWMILLLLIQMFSKNLRIRVRCRWGILAIFIIFTNSWLIDAYAKWWQPAPNPLTGNTTYSCAIVLGGFGSPDKNEVGFFKNLCHLCKLSDYRIEIYLGWYQKVLVYIMYPSSFVSTEDM